MIAVALCSTRARNRLIRFADEKRHCFSFVRRDGVRNFRWVCCRFSLAHDIGMENLVAFLCRCEDAVQDAHRLSHGYGKLLYVKTLRLHGRSKAPGMWTVPPGEDEVAGAARRQYLG